MMVPVSSRLQGHISTLHGSLTAVVESDRANARQNLFDLGDLLAHDSTKFHFLFQGGSESKALQREVAQLGGEVLIAFRALLDRILEQKFSGPLPNELCGRVMNAAKALKRLPTDQQSAVQRQLLRDAANVKSVLKDVEEMVQAHAEERDGGDEVANAMLQMDVGTEESFAGAGDLADVMNMDVSLSAEELAIAEAGLTIVRSALALQKAAARILMPQQQRAPPEPPAQVPPAPPPDADTDTATALETLSLASKSFTRAVEDLGALVVLDQSECRASGQTAVAELQQAVAALATLSASRPGCEALQTEAAAAAAAASEALSSIP